MIVTEKEAKTRWCYRTMGFADRNAGNNPYAEKCVASMCMAWRWHFQANEPAHTMMAVYPPQQTTYTKTDKGYCGLAGSCQHED